MDDTNKAEEELELYFFNHIFGTKDFKVIIIPDVDGYIITPEESASIRKKMDKTNTTLGYFISKPDGSCVIFKPGANIIGFIPEAVEPYYYNQ